MALSTFALTLEYDGGAFSGSQFQANARSVQSAMEEALAPLGLRGRIAFAGRTDAGVHARGQMAAALLPESWTPAALLKAANALLPDDVVVVTAALAPDNFDPRRAASGRCYRYKLLTGHVRSPLLRRDAWHVWQPLNVEAMAQAASVLRGEHDFAAFGGPVDPPGASTIRKMFEVSVSGEGPLLRLDFEANAFLPHQVRRTVGALVQVGRGKLEIGEFEALLRDARPGTAGPAAPGHGLCLIHVAYEGVRFEVGNT